MVDFISFEFKSKAKSIEWREKRNVEMKESI